MSEQSMSERIAAEVAEAERKIDEQIGELQLERDRVNAEIQRLREERKSLPRLRKPRAPKAPETPEY